MVTTSVSGIRVLLAGALFLWGVPAHAQEFHPMVTDGKLDERVHGLWQSRGYGWIAWIDENEFSIYDHCPAGVMKIENGLADLIQWMGLFRREGSTMVVASSPQNSTSYTFDRIYSPPSPLDQPPEGDPATVFDYFWSTMDTYYAFFEIYDVDWDARRVEHRSRITSESTDAELFAVLCDMLSGMNDGHLSLTATLEGKKTTYSDGGTRVLDPALEKAFAAQEKIKTMGAYWAQWRRDYRESVATRVLSGEYTLVANGNMVWGRIGTIGYMNVLGMGGFSGSEDMDVEKEAIHEAMEEMVAALADTEGMIVDVTLNTGGYDEVQLAIASHFTDEPVLAFTKFPVEAEDVEPQSFFVEPALRGRYRKPVSLVTSDFTVSASEDFTLAMRSIDTVTHRGMRTRGAFSDVLEKALPNGWTVTLSNEVYLDAEGRHWEGYGITPEDPIAIFDPADIGNSHPNAILKLAASMASGPGE